MARNTSGQPTTTELKRIQRDQTTEFAKQDAEREKKLRDEKTARLRVLRLENQKDH
jgi:hypothetical protein